MGEWTLLLLYIKNYLLICLGTLIGAYIIKYIFVDMMEVDDDRNNTIHNS